MVSFLNSNRTGPIGVDIGSRSVKLLQFNAARSELWEAAHPQDLSNVDKRARRPRR